MIEKISTLNEYDLGLAIAFLLGVIISRLFYYMWIKFKEHMGYE